MTKVSEWLVVDIETDGDPFTGTLVSVGVWNPATGDGTTFRNGMPEWLLDTLANPEVGTIEHTLYDARWLRLHGVVLNGPIIDTRVMAWNDDENQALDLDSLVFRYCHYRMDKRIRASKKLGIRFQCDDGSIVPIQEAPIEDLHRYNLDDAHQTSRLYTTLIDKQPEWWGKQIQLTSVLLDMECAGLPIDTDMLEWTRESFDLTREQIRAELTKDLPPAFNLNSGDQVAAFLFLDEFDLPGRVPKGEEPEGFTPSKVGRLWTHGSWQVKGLGMTPTKWTESETRPATDSKTLAVKHGAHPWVAQYLEYQKLDTLLGNFIETLPKYTHEGRVYGTFNQAGTVSGRLSSANPNLQNQPRRGNYGAQMRALYRGNLIVADFSQLEPRIAAHLSQDPELLQVYKHDLDLYMKTGSFVYGCKYMEVTTEQREAMKLHVLSMNYGAQARKLAEILSVAGFPTTQREAQRNLEALREAYARFFEWREETIQFSKDHGYVVTLAGRKRHIGYTGGDQGWRAERQAVNSEIQGSAADIVNATMLEVAQIPDIQQLVQVHDELVCEYFDHTDTEKACQMIREAGETKHGLTLSVPLVFEPKVCETWADK